MKKAIIIGASSGIGKSLAKTLAEDGYRVGLAARRLSPLLALQQEIGNQTLVKQIDVSNISEAMLRFSDMAQGEGLFWVASPEQAARQIC